MAFHREAELAVCKGCIATEVRSFFGRAEREGVDEFRVVLGDCQRGPMSSFPSGWGIFATGDHGNELWQPTWRSVLVRYDEEPAFRVSYHAVKHSPWMSKPDEPLDSLHERQRRLVMEALQVCVELDLAPLFEAVRRASAGSQLGSNIASLVASPRIINHNKLPILSAVENILLVESEAWRRALEGYDINERLKKVTDQMWSTSMCILEASVTRVLSCQNQTSPTLGLSIDP